VIKSLLVAAFAAAAFSLSATAAEVEVKMLNKGADGMFVFEPSLVKIAPGDSVRFVATDKGHNVESIDGMIPDGAAPFSFKIGEEAVVAFDKPGVYGYKCKPHYPMGMVGLIAPADAVAAPSFSAHGSARQVYVTGLAPNARMSLITPRGTTLYTRRADSLGGLLFRNVPPGRRYRVRLASTRAESGPITRSLGPAAPARRSSRRRSRSRARCPGTRSRPSSRSAGAGDR